MKSRRDDATPPVSPLLKSSKTSKNDHLLLIKTQASAFESLLQKNQDTMTRLQAYISENSELKAKIRELEEKLADAGQASNHRSKKDAITIQENQTSRKMAGRIGQLKTPRNESRIRYDPTPEFEREADLKKPEQHLRIKRFAHKSMQTSFENDVQRNSRDAEEIGRNQSREEQARVSYKTASNARKESESIRRADDRINVENNSSGRIGPQRKRSNLSGDDGSSNQMDFMLYKDAPSPGTPDVQYHLDIGSELSPTGFKGRNMMKESSPRSRIPLSYANSPKRSPFKTDDAQMNRSLKGGLIDKMLLKSQTTGGEIDGRTRKNHRLVIPYCSPTVRNASDGMLQSELVEQTQTSNKELSYRPKLIQTPYLIKKPWLSSCFKHFGTSQTYDIKTALQHFKFFNETLNMKRIRQETSPTQRTLNRSDRKLERINKFIENDFVDEVETLSYSNNMQQTKDKANLTHQTVAGHSRPNPVSSASRKDAVSASKYVDKTPDKRAVTATPPSKSRQADRELASPGLRTEQVRPQNPIIRPLRDREFTWGKRQARGTDLRSKDLLMS